MPTRTGTPSRVSPSTSQIVWTGLLNGDDGSPLEWVDGAADSYVTVSGTFGVGGSVSMQGSADGVTFDTMTEGGGTTAATFTAAGGGPLNGTPRYFRPIVTAGDGTTALTVTLSLNRYVRA